MVQIEMVYNYKSKQKKCDQICVKMKKYGTIMFVKQWGFNKLNKQF